MADDQEKDSPKRMLKKRPESFRERAEKAQTKTDKPRRLRIRKTATSIGKPVKKAAEIGGKEYYLPMPDNRVGRFMNKRRRWIPAYFRNSWKELRLVEWPDRKSTAKLTLAVFIFALVFGTLVAFADYGLDKLFRKVILKI
jgi:preprotein translocase SecE subunit